MDDLLKKAITQDKLTLDTVDAQFCSNWLKDQIRDVFVERDQMAASYRELSVRLDDIERDCLTLEKERDRLHEALKTAIRNVDSDGAVIYLRQVLRETGKRNE